MYRSHTCAQVTKSHIDQHITLSGWVRRRRDHGGLIFIDLADRYGITQIVFDPEVNKEAHAKAEDLRSEYVVKVSGTVRARPSGMENPNIITGEIEVAIDTLDVLTKSKPLPFELDENTREVNEELRLKHRYLDLRTDRMKENMAFRSKFIRFVHDWFQKHDFLEVQTPILTSSSPEGARDFLVPSRLNPGSFYALPQAPQQYKQLLMVGGIDRYYQIAPCFRDEDPRADRSPGEFYQIDVEASFMTQDEFFDLIEPFFHEVVKELVSHKHIPWEVFPRISYDDAMQKYGSDRPDLRFGMQIEDVSDIFTQTEFGVFKNAIAQDNGAIKALKLENKDLTRKEIDTLTQTAQNSGAKGLAYIIFDKQEGPRGPIVKFFTEDELSKLRHRLNVRDGDTVFFGADSKYKASEALGAVRIALRDMFDLADKSSLAFAWIVDFPMYEWDEETKKWDFSHNPFSLPQGGIDAIKNDNPGSILAYQYDIICNGLELSSGAVRNYDPELLVAAFEKVGYGEEEIKEKFKALYDAFQYGAPPHCGFAPGLDRMIMLFCDEPNIREVIPFPKNGKAQDALMGAPGQVYESQRKELGIHFEEQNKNEEPQADKTSDPKSVMDW